MSWINVEKELPMTYKTGHWDGVMSDLVLAEDIEGKRYLAKMYQGVLDGGFFQDWYECAGSLEREYPITKPILRWMELPD